MHSTQLPAITFENRPNGSVITLCGDVRLHNLSTLESTLISYLQTVKNLSVLWKMDALSHFDSAAALWVLLCIRRIEEQGGSSRIEGLNPRFAEIMNVAEEHRGKINALSPADPGWMESVGRATCDRLGGWKSFLAFFGQASYMLLLFIRQLGTIRYKEIIFEMNESAVKALGIIALTTFLIGIVVAYQSAVQLKLYGANIFIVDMIGISVLRELAPLITAIVVAGRSGSAYAAQIGVMKITEELDAMRTMGFDPFAFLVLPRMIALTLMMPLMIFFADVMGVLGGMLIANVELGISVELFMDRFNSVVDIRHYVVGIVKGPFFAMLIATIGIYRGMQVKNDTQSIGLNTTKSVVESIFAVIICDAIFSIMFTKLGI